MLYMTITASGCFFAGLFFDYRKLKKIFDEITFRMDALDKKYLVPEVVSAKGGQEREQILDILKEAELSMGDQVSQYKRAAEEYRDYIETWVHEVKTPLATAKVILENHKEEPLAKSGMDVEIDRIEGFVEQALYYSRSMAVENDYFIRQIDIGKIIRSEIGRRKKRFRLLGALVEVEVADPDTEEVHRGAAGRIIRSDEKWIGFVIGQILDNSLKYAKENESLKLHIFISEENERVCLNIRDNGIGMKASEIGRAFEKGFTGTNGRAARASTGIGLYLCKKLCNRLEHDIRIESEEGNGTTVTIVF
ncbi:MAG: sensor histidine kinase [Lachnospiraceae bacterium]|nr:sensor histidine kinase [Lachnospiraceae bacterium]